MSFELIPIGPLNPLRQLQGMKANLSVAVRWSLREPRAGTKTAHVRNGSWLCENSSARRARRNISQKLRIMESNRAARTMFNSLSENCIFYISQLYEFL